MKNTVLIVLLAVLVSGCAMERKSRADFDRHQNSLLRTSYQDSSMLVFEARAGAAYPADSEAAEAVRMEWLQAWLDVQRLCPAGYEIISREPITAGQPNFHDMDLRYLLKCLPGTPGQ